MSGFKKAKKEPNAAYAARVKDWRIALRTRKDGDPFPTSQTSQQSFIALANLNVTRTYSASVSHAPTAAQPAAQSNLAQIKAEREELMRQRLAKQGRKVDENKLHVQDRLENLDIKFDSTIARDKSEEFEDRITLPLVSELTDPEREGVLEKKSSGLFDKSWKPMLCMIKEGYLFWMKDKKEKQPAGMLKVIKSTIKAEIHDSVLELSDTAVKKETHYFRVVGGEEGDVLDEWVRSFKVSKVRKFHRKAVSSLFGSYVNVQSDIKEIQDAMQQEMGIKSLDSAAATKEIEQKRKDAMELLKKGGWFQKYKRKSPQKRYIWISDTFDRILWGDDKKNFKGYLLVNDIAGLAQGCLGAKKPNHAFTIQCPSRDLELEADTQETRDGWIAALRVLTGK